jgi:hypothetical protein
MKKHFDNQYRNAFEHLETPPPPMVWQAVEAHLDNKKRRRGAAFWWASGVLVAASISAFVLLPNKELTMGDGQLAIDDKQQGMSKGQLAIGDEQLAIDNKQWAISKEQLAIDKEQEAISKDQGAVSNGQEVSDINVATAFSNNKKENKISDKPLIKSNLIEVKQIDVLYPKSVISNMEEKIAFSDCYEFTKKKRKSKSFYIDGYFGFDVVNKNLANKGREATKLLDYRQESEKVVNAFSGGIRIGAVRGNIGLSSGLQVNHIVERFENIDEYSERTNININKITDANGNVIRLDTVVTTVRGKASSAIYNRYTTFNIPLQLSYHTGVNNWKLAIYAGPVFNLQLKKSGTIFNENKIPTAFDNNSTAFKSSIGVSFMASANLSRRLTEHFYCFVEPTFLYQPNAITTTSYALSQTYKSSIGLYLGLRYKL